MSNIIIRKGSRLRDKYYLLGRINIPTSVTVETTGKHLSVSGALGTVRTDLNKLDAKGGTALKLDPEQRQIAIASCDKHFFGTIQTLIQNSISVSSSSCSNIYEQQELGLANFSSNKHIPRDSLAQDQVRADLTAWFAYHGKAPLINQDLH